MIGVIGGSGFIGGALVRALQQAGHDVRIIDRAEPGLSGRLDRSRRA